jgi:hypothetical protein
LRKTKEQLFNQVPEAAHEYVRQWLIPF